MTMRHAHLTTLALAFLLSGCRSPTTTDGLSVVTSLSPGSFRAGGLAEIRITVTNHGYLPRTIRANACGATTVTAAAELSEQRIDADCDGSLQLVTLEHGDQIVLKRPWQGDIRTGEFLGTSVLLPPGTYLLRSRVGVVYGEDVIHWRDIESRPARVTLTP
jgi:hypothetical protein